MLAATTFAAPMDLSSSAVSSLFVAAIDSGLGGGTALILAA